MVTLFNQLSSPLEFFLCRGAKKEPKKAPLFCNAPRKKGALRRVRLKLVTLMSAPGRRRRCYTTFLFLSLFYQEIIIFFV